MKTKANTRAVFASIERKATGDRARQVVEQADALSVRRETFETEELARSNKALYAILSDVYALFTHAVGDKCLPETVKAMREGLKKRNVRVQSNSPALTVFVRYVFNSDRKRAYNYASTLMAAVQADVKPAELADFIESKNGVEECKKQFVKKAETAAKEAKLKLAGEEVVRLLPDAAAIAKLQVKNTKVELGDGTQYAFLLARVASDSSYEVLRVVPKTTLAMQSAALKELAKQFLEQQEKQAREAKVRRAEATTVKAAAGLKLRELEPA